MCAKSGDHGADYFELAEGYVDDAVNLGEEGVVSGQRTWIRKFGEGNVGVPQRWRWRFGDGW